MRDIKIDYVTNTITVTKVFLEAASTPYSEESITLHSLQQDFPNMRIVTRNLPRRNISNQYKGLTYKYMRKFISIMDEKNLPVFNRIQLYYEGLYEDSATIYSNVRDWFLKNYPLHKEMIESKEPTRVSSTNSGSSPQAA